MSQFAIFVTIKLKPGLGEAFRPHILENAAGSAIRSLQNGTAQVAQSAVSQGILTLERGDTPAARHFAQINELDGFFLTARDADPGFAWDK